MNSKYIFKDIEKKWMNTWEKEKTYTVDLKNAKKPFYNLMMFPYPSAEGLHIGNVYAYIGSDIQGRFMKAHGYDVFEPIGFDAFGIHSENYALKQNQNPWNLIPQNIRKFKTQLKRIGALFDWPHVVNTTDPSYYKWTQWIFLTLFKQGLAYRKEAPLNYCPSCKTVLADEQVENGTCERCTSQVETKNMKQWFFKITAYADRLLSNLDWIDWPEITKKTQRHWIGKSEGAEICFKVKGSDRKLPVFTTRADTLFGVTFIVLSPQHPLIHKISLPARQDHIKQYLNGVKQKNSSAHEKEEDKKFGIFTGSYALHPVTRKEIPIWISDYVLSSYGTGAIMGVPAHDQRDYDFAKKYNLPVVPVIKSLEKVVMNTVYSGDGILINSGRFSGMQSKESIPKIIDFLQEKGCGKKKLMYRLHDWCISRQRYWGPPIPIIYCKTCGVRPVPENDLPVVLPYIEDFRPDGSGKSPLARNDDFIHTCCPECRKPAKRETDVSDNFLDSAWYFFRYPNAKRDDRAFDKKITEKWLPVDMYIGGNEHAVLHLMYTRFLTMAFHDIGLISFEEPFKKFRANGMIIRDGIKMSKTKGNVINPDEYITEYGIDVFRTYLMFFGNFKEGGDFRDKGIPGIKRFIEKLRRYCHENKFIAGKKFDKDILRLLNMKIKQVTEDIKKLDYNTAIAVLWNSIMDFL